MLLMNCSTLKKNKHLQKKGCITPSSSYSNSVLFTLKPFGFGAYTDLKWKTIALTDSDSTSDAILPTMKPSKTASIFLLLFFGAQLYAGFHDRSIKFVLNIHFISDLISP